MSLQYRRKISKYETFHESQLKNTVCSSVDVENLAFKAVLKTFEDIGSYWKLFEVI